jgi:fumarate hydratase class I
MKKNISKSSKAKLTMKAKSKSVGKKNEFLKGFRKSIYELLVETSTNLPCDVRSALQKAIEGELPNSQSSFALQTIALNIDMACESKSPICQDTGMPTFEIYLPADVSQTQLQREIISAVKMATKNGKLRPNAVDPLTGKNSGTNVGYGFPPIHFYQWNKNSIEVKLLLKGGGCENKNIQYSLPCELPYLGKADRTLDGVRKCLLHAVWQAQGQGCSVGAIGVAVGGDRASGYEFAKEQLFRELDDVNPNPDLSKLETYILENANKLNIGTMGFGGQTTLIGCKIGAYHRLPASYFVSVAYNCWAFRRLGMALDVQTGKIKHWLYRNQKPAKKMSRQEVLHHSGREIPLSLPLSEEQARCLKVGDVVLLNGVLHMGRDMLHHYLLTHDSPVSLQGSALYHCGPVVLNKNGEWIITAAGPTTSIREEPYQADILKKFHIRAIIGKGGMGKKTLDALKEVGAVYLSAIGGAAQYYARCIKNVIGVDFLEFGTPEAMWHVEVENFPAIVTMDAQGNSLHAKVEEQSALVLSSMRDAIL